MTISYKALKSFEGAVPMIRIANCFLKSMGFNIGDKVSVQYGKEEIIIKKLN